MSEINGLTIKPETPRDYRETENMVREAFWDVYKPGCDEHLIVHNLRKTDAFIKELNFVAKVDNKVVGVIMLPISKIKNTQGKEFSVLSMILGVLPKYQNKGIGSKLVQTAIDKATSLGLKGIVLFGSPEYYPRFGFKNALRYRIQTSDGENFDPFMALELSKNSLDGIEGKFFEGPVFHPDNDELELFDKSFPHKEKHITDTQLK